MPFSDKTLRKNALETQLSLDPRSPEVYLQTVPCSFSKVWNEGGDPRIKRERDIFYMHTYIHTPELCRDTQSHCKLTFFHNHSTTTHSHYHQFIYNRTCGSCLEYAIKQKQHTNTHTNSLKHNETTNASEQSYSKFQHTKQSLSEIDLTNK